MPLLLYNAVLLGICRWGEGQANWITFHFLKSTLVIHRGGCIKADTVVDRAIVGNKSDAGKFFLMVFSLFITTKRNRISVTAKVNFG